MRAFSLRWLLIISLFIPLLLQADTQERANNAHYIDFAELVPSQAHRRVATEITRIMTRQHFAQVVIDAELEQKVMRNYLQHLDPNRALLTRTQAEAWLQQSSAIRPALMQGELQLPFQIYIELLELHEQRLQQVLQRLNHELDSFRFDQDIRFQVDRSQLDWAEDSAALDTYWNQRVTHELLGLMDAEKTPEEARDLLVRRYDNHLKRLHQTNSEDVFMQFINAFTTVIDPHTNYLSPRNSESFNIQMRLSLEGIGALLQSDNEYVKVVSLIPGGPAERQGQLKPNDRIIGVGQDEDGEIENVIGWRLDEVVDQIRGPKGSIVRLEVLDSDNTNRRIIRIERNAVQLEDQAASKQLLEVNINGETRRIGVIEIPAFYMDFEGRRTQPNSYRSTTRDVARLIQELQAEGMEALVIDLRNNGGGALQEANSLVGLFVSRGPSVQVLDADGNVNVLRDNSQRALYAGPLAVVINRLSASASEIFAGAIQDYGRGLVVGQQSFGKGTVQTILDLSHGQLKITRAKFYRISGESTQHRGVIPDIAFPPLLDPEVIGESASENALPWDRVSAVLPPRNALIEARLPQLLERHQQRIQQDANFQFLVAQSEWMARNKSTRNSISLNQAIRQQEREQLAQEQLAIENQRRSRLGLPLLEDPDALEDEREADSEEATPVDLAVLRETGLILLDLQELQNQALTRK